MCNVLNYQDLTGRPDQRQERMEEILCELMSMKDSHGLAVAVPGLAEIAFIYETAETELRNLKGGTTECLI